MNCKILNLSQTNLEICGEQIRKGQLVAFPTETVYGLGANAFDVKACLKIYKTKNRPLTDPVIIHISKKTQIEELVIFTEKQKQLFEVLQKSFWPGPLTMVFKRSEKVPIELTAQTNFIGIRMPDHPTALKLIEIAKRPIAAPSANIFNHVSPVTAKHVYDDFQDKEVTILNDGKTTLGIESTVVKVDDNELTFFRLGSLPVDLIKNCLDENGFKDIKYIQKQIKKKDDENVQSPGQFIKHYSPNVQCLLVNNLDDKNKQYSETVLIDFGGVFKKYQSHFLAYFDLSEIKSVKEGMYNLYEILRKSETVPKCKQILIRNFNKKEIKELKELMYFDSLYDKIFRSCSGKFFNQFNRKQCYQVTFTIQRIYFRICTLIRDYKNHLTNLKLIYKSKRNPQTSIRYHLRNKNKNMSRDIKIQNNKISRMLKSIKNRKSVALPKTLFPIQIKQNKKKMKRKQIKNENYRFSQKLSKMQIKKKSCHHKKTTSQRIFKLFIEIQRAQAFSIAKIKLIILNNIFFFMQTNPKQYHHSQSSDLILIPRKLPFPFFRISEQYCLLSWPKIL